MDVSDNTILITGGTSGIGLELATRFLALNNTVIVTGRDPQKLQRAQRQLPGIHAIQSDAGDAEAIRRLHGKLTLEFPALNVLINNAGIMRKLNLHDPVIDLNDVTREIDINLMGPIRMVQQFLPSLKKQRAAAIVNVSSGLAFVPLPISPVYSASKAAIHSFTLSLRIQLKNTRVKVFELAPPGTDTPLFRGDFSEEDVKGVAPMDVKTLADHAIKGLRKDTYEIRPGAANVLKLMSRIAPQLILGQLGKSADLMLAETKSRV
jgi:uncharacterized oxidoreductase